MIDGQNHRFESYVIFAVKPESVEDFRQWAGAVSLPHKELIGSYRGQREVSFITPVDAYREQVWPAGWTETQESVLQLTPQKPRRGGERHAWLVYKDGAAEYLGVWRQVAKYEAIEEPGWTYDPTLEAYFVAKPDCLPVGVAVKEGDAVARDLEPANDNSGGRTYNWIC